MSAHHVRLLCIADSQSKRWNAFADSIKEYSIASKVIVKVDLIEWQELIDADGDLLAVELFDPDSFERHPAVVRIESPGKDFEIVRGLLAAGARETGNPDDAIWSDVAFEKGKIVEPRLVFLGLERILHRLRVSAGKIQGLSFLADPADIASMFDKNATSARLSASGISTPEVFKITDWPADCQRPESAGDKPELEFFKQLRSRGFRTYFAKLAFGSASCGILTGRVGADATDSVSTMIRIDGQFFNTRALQTVDVSKIGDWLGFLVKQGVTVQKGISKSVIDGDNFDVRVVVIDGQVEFTIFRVSQHPVTGLHFGGYRGDWNRCRAAIPDRAWYEAMDDCVRAAELYDSHVVGVDLAFDRSYMNHFIIELNPFGDFFPGWTNDHGKSIHRVEIESIVATVKQT